MTTLRAFFILRDEEIIFSKRFPIIEKKIEVKAASFSALPSDASLSAIFLSVNSFSNNL